MPVNEVKESSESGEHTGAIRLRHMPDTIPKPIVAPGEAHRDCIAEEAVMFGMMGQHGAWHDRAVILDTAIRAIRYVPEILELLCNSHAKTRRSIDAEHRVPYLAWRRLGQRQAKRWTTESLNAQMQLLQPTVVSRPPYVMRRSSGRRAAPSSWRYFCAKSVRPVTFPAHAYRCCLDLRLQHQEHLLLCTVFLWAACKSALPDGLQPTGCPQEASGGGQHYHCADNTLQILQARLGFCGRSSAGQPASPAREHLASRILSSANDHAVAMCMQSLPDARLTGHV